MSFGLISAAVGGASALLGGSSASSAARSQERAANRQLDLQRETRDLSRGDLAPYRETGELFNDILNFELGAGPAPTVGSVAAPEVTASRVTSSGAPAGALFSAQERGMLSDADLTRAREAVQAGGQVPADIMRQLGRNPNSQPIYSREFTVDGRTFNNRAEANAYAQSQAQPGQTLNNTRQTFTDSYGPNPTFNALTVGDFGRTNFVNDPNFMGVRFENAGVDDFMDFNDAYGSFDPNATFEESPGLQFALDKSGEAVQSSAAMRHGLLSGATQNAMQENAQGLALQDFWRWQGRQDDLAGQMLGRSDALKTFTLGRDDANTQWLANRSDALKKYRVGRRDENTRFNALRNDNNLRYTTGRDDANSMWGTARQDGITDNYWNMLTGRVASGQSAAAGSAAVNQNFASGSSDALANLGNAGAARQIGQYNALTNGINAGFQTYGYLNGYNPLRPN